MRILLFFVLFPFFSQAQQMDNSPPVYGVCEKENLETRAKCTHRAIQKYIETNLHYPDKALQSGQEGLVMVKLTIDEKGQSQSPEILLSKCKYCEPEAIRLVNGLQKWKPARREGTPIATQISIPIYFSISDSLQQSTQLFISLGQGQNQLSKSQVRKLWDSPIEIYDNFGKKYPVNELYVAFEKDTTLTDAYSPSGKKTKDMKKIIRQVEPGGILVFCVYTNKGLITKPVHKYFEITE